MLHSFFYPETVKAFSAIPQTDPSCAIAYWGIAVSLRPNPLAGPFDAATLKRGLEADRGLRWYPPSAARAVSYNKEARTLRIWEYSNPQPVTQEVFSPLDCYS